MERKILAVFASFLILTLIPIVSAQCYVDGKQVPCDQSWPAFLGMGVVAFVIIFVVGALIILAFVFWIWMLIDCLQRDFEDKLVWVIVLVLLAILGAVLYYFLVRAKDKKHRRRQMKKR